VRLLVILPLPLLAAILSWSFPTRKFAPTVTLICTVAVLWLTASTAFEVAAGHAVMVSPHWLGLDGLGALVLLLVAWVSALAALFSWGYLEQHAPEKGRRRIYYTNFNLFVFALLAVPAIREPNLEWIAVELTALFSVLLVAYDNTHETLEAAWKYVALMFMGAAIALLGFLILFWAFRSAGGTQADYSWDGLRAIAPRLPPVLTRAAFLLILVGFGTKVGIVPLHTWLPDAHSQAPSPACALLSGVKTTVALYIILRLVPFMPSGQVHNWLLAAGLVSLGAAAFLLLQVRDYKRLFAFSTVEHMGIILVAVGLGSTAARYGAMAQMITHSITKSFCFFAAGAALLAVGTREIAEVRGLIHRSPASGIALIFGGLAISGAPPMAVFLSEFSIFKSGLAQGRYVVTGLLVLFIAVAFFGVLWHLTRMVFGGSPKKGPPEIRLPLTCRLTLLLAALPVLVFGLYVPKSLHNLIELAAAALAPVTHS
jgi:hydrogenase-4 component F